MTKNKEKYFDCIKMKGNIQKQIYTETQNMSVKELLNYFNNKHATNTEALNCVQKSNPQIKPII